MIFSCIFMDKITFNSLLRITLDLQTQENASPNIQLLVLKEASLLISLTFVITHHPLLSVLQYQNPF